LIRRRDYDMTETNSKTTASIILAAGKGSRMIGYDGNKTLLPLIPSESPYEGTHPLLAEVLENLPRGPKGIIVHHRADDVRESMRKYGASFIFQPATNGTGGAILAARSFLESIHQDSLIITMGDVPLIRPATYERLVHALEAHELAVLAFVPRDRAQYGMLEMEGDRVVRVVEWKYWHTFAPEDQARLRFCNAGVYTARRMTLLDCLDRLAARPHTVKKQRGDQWVDVEEYFLTDIVELMTRDGLGIGMVVATEEEVVGVDTPEALGYVQGEFRKLRQGSAEGA
jgi:bifunctional UDP-N-acetylglucosamine pyrophosphorylase/glucosamine-1-phosphate N-acetyltransferase